jgi:GTPase SAR1 family protein
VLIFSTEAIQEQKVLPRVVLGFMGDSGSGKSSIINALIEKEFLLPCNGTEACTAVAVEVGWNASSDKSKAYRAEIHFVNVAEWKHELESLVNELLLLAPDKRLNPGNEDVKVAAAKIRAVYPDILFERLSKGSPAELINHICVSPILGRVEVIEMAAKRENEFAAAISEYIDSTLRNPPEQGKRPQYWPLVKAVKIYLKSPVLSTGLVLVDLPGFGDSNAARQNVAQGYMEQLSGIWNNYPRFVSLQTLIEPYQARSSRIFTVEAPL